MKAAKGLLIGVVALCGALSAQGAFAVPTGTLVINGGTPITAVPTVNLTLTASVLGGLTISSMQFNNDDRAHWSDWEPFAATKSWDLSAGEGLKSVYVRYRDSGGNISTSIIGDSIKLDFAAGWIRVAASSKAIHPDGHSWCTAYKTLQAGTDAALAVGGGEIWVQEGTYTATVNPVLAMKNRVSAYGGFAGTETARNQRDWTAHATVIDGEDTRRCVVGANLAVLDGFTITRGKSVNSGAGLYNFLASPTIANCTFLQNTAMYGSGMYNESSSSPTVTNCTFKKNTAAGMYNSDCSPTVMNCAFNENEGGGMRNMGGSPTVTNCIFTGNSSPTGSGGGMYNNSNSARVTNCMFAQNTAKSGGGMANIGGSPTVTNCTFTLNSATNQGGAMYGSSSSAAFTNCILWGNTAPTSPGIYDDVSKPDLVVSYSCVQGGCAGTGNISVDPLLATAPGEVRLLAGSPCIDTATATGAPATDILGVPRPQGAGVDMGACEFGPLRAPTVTSASAITINNTPTWAWASGCDCSGRYRYGFTDGVWDLAEDTTETPYTPPSPLAEGSYTLYVQECDNAGLWSPSGWFTVVVDATEPTGTLLINGGAAATGPLTVTLNLTADDGAGSGTAEMRFSNDGTAWSDWEPFKTSKYWLLPAGDGSKTVFAQFRDRAGNVSSETISDDILVDSALISPVKVFCVDAASTAVTPDGQSWYTAYNTLQAAMNAASAAGGGELWVKAGTYTAGTNPALTMKAGVSVYGGFAGAEIAREQRDWTVNISKIDGRGSNRCVNTADDTTLDGLTIYNGKENYGGGIYNSSSSVTLANCIFTKNNATAFGGGIYNAVDSSATIKNCAFTQNAATSNGGGIYTGDGMGGPGAELLLTDCVFSGNTAKKGGGLFCQCFSPTVTRCMFTGNTAGNLGGAVYNDANPLKLLECTFAKNSSSSYGGAVYNNNGAMLVSKSSFTGNKATDYGGGLAQFGVAATTLTDCAFDQNSARYGGGVYNTSATPTLTNCVFLKNGPATYGGAMYNAQSSPVLTNCTLTQNSAYYGGAMYDDSTSSPTLKNCILWADSASVAREIYVVSANPTVSYSCIWGGYTGTGNISADPLFTDPSGGDLQLSGGSPCIDTGTATDAPVTDIAGVPRPLGAGVDMGAYEFPLVPAPAVTSASALTNNSTPTWTWTSGNVAEGSGFYRCGFAEGAWDLVEGASVTSFTPAAPLADGSYTLYVQERTQAGYWSGSGFYTVMVDASGPTGFIVINDGAATTWVQTVNLSLVTDDRSISDVSVMQFSNDGTDWSPWEPYTAGKTWTLSDGYGLKTVYVRYRDVLGNVSSYTISDTITFALDVDLPTGNIEINGGAATTNDPVVNLRLTVCDGEGSGVTDMCFSDDGAVWTDWEPYALSKSWTLTAGDGLKTVEVHFRDAMGNVTPGPISDSILLDTTQVTPGIICVNAASTAAAPDGRSWATAYPTLQAGTDAASTGGGEVWVRAGTYTAVTNPVLTMKAGVTLYGGFAGTETLRRQRDPAVNLSIISGEDARRCVVGANNATLEGFTITHGYATPCSGGMYNGSTSPTVAHCVFTHNFGPNGGGMYNGSSYATVTDCIFAYNTASWGGGLCNGGGAPTITNCTFTCNKADGGGGVYNNNSSAMLTNCTVTGNTGTNGGGINNYGSSPVLTNCVIAHNEAMYGGAVYNSYKTTAQLMNCSIACNRASLNGGALYNTSATPTVTNSVLWADTAPTGPEIYNSSSTPVVTWSCVQGGYTGTGNINWDPLFVDSAGGSLQLQFGSFCVNAGTPDGAPATDLLGRARLVGVRIDIGAYEGVVMPADIVTLALKEFPGGSGNTFPAQGIHSYGRGEPVTVTVKPLGLRFAEWTGDLATTTPTASVVMDENKTLTANFTSNIVYVNAANAAGPWDGRSWITAFKDLQSGVDQAARDLGGEVWAAAGTYINVTPGIANAPVLTMKPGIHLYGGFISTETSRGQRNWTANVTAIDGQDAYVGVYGADDGLMDGFTIMRGKASEGGGMRNSAVSPTVAHCAFTQNTATYNGGGMYNVHASPTVTDCIFTQNTASGSCGGGIYNSYASPMVTNSIFTQNTVPNGSGGGMGNSSASPTVTNCVFTQNTVSSYGGGMYNYSLAPTVTNCTFTLNSATVSGGGIYNSYASPMVTNCILWGDGAATSPEISNAGTAAPLVTWTSVQGGYAGTGNINANPLFMSAPGDLRLQAASPCINTGTAVGAPATDMLGVPRPMGVGVDMGAYEYHTLLVFGGIVINNGARSTTTPDVTLSLNWSSLSGSPATRMRFSDDGATWSPWEPVAATRAYTLPGPDGYKTVRVQFRDGLGNVSDRLNDYIMLDANAPTGTIVINGGAASTKDPNVTLALTWSDGTGSGVTRMRFSDNGSTWTAWETLKATKPHTLPLPPGGNQTVRVQYRDVAGNTSARFSDYIRLDLP